ncbi:MAG: choice-of-anchor L domain-containing protein, partial [Bacteroidetes bacterium]|nr:choice-of-anchor L domain-containing protein [Bacteroidota bacterium]
MKFQRFLLLFLIISSVSFGQLTFTNNPSATALAQSVVGFGVTVSNASLTCASGASAIFGNGASTTLGITNGILLTTGTASLVNNAAGNGFLGLNVLSVSNNVAGDALMDGLTGQGAGSSYDRCKLEFDITAQCSNLLINYKFGSEEYPDYVGGGVNDAFGFFISGANPAGGNYTNFNMATVPGTSLPVNIENVNNGVNNSGPCKNCAYYVNNSSSANIEYDGITTLLTASANITPCANYHLILEIADGGDNAYDSGVFLQFGGLSCKTPTITTNAVASSCTANTGSAAVNVTGVLPATYSWSPGGQTTSSITNQAAGTYTCTMTFTNGVCAPIIQTQTVTITSPGVSPTVAVSSNTPCAGATLSLTATSNGNGYTWTGPNSFSSASQNPTIAAAATAASGIYTLVVTNAGGCSKTTTLSVTLAPPPTLTVTSGATCLGGSTTLTASGATNYTWSPGTGLSATTGSAVTANPVVTTVYTITGATGACIGTGTSTVSITGSPTVTVNSGSVCSGNSLTLTATGAANYTWSPATGLSATAGSVVVANPGSTIVYSILGANGSCTSTASSTVNVTTTPTVSVNSGSICSGSSLALNASGATTYSWSPSSSLNTSTGSSVSANPNTTTIYAVIGANGSCTATASSTVNVTTTPTVSVNSASICSGSSATLTA